jgi:glycosyltransferase involved in cell wall biosynthesis
VALARAVAEGPRLRIAQVAPPLERVPPAAYGGTERVIAELIHELTRRGHHVVLFGPGDSDPGCPVVPTVARALWPQGFGGDPTGYYVRTIQQVLERQDQFDVIHSHLEWLSLALAAAAHRPCVATFHGRLDLPFAGAALASAGAGRAVAISRAQAAAHPDAPWAGVVHNGLRLARAPAGVARGEGLCFVGRVAPEKGIMHALEIARLAGRPLRIAARIGSRPPDRAYADEVFRPALARYDAEFMGELGEADRDRLLAQSYACLMPGHWPEPFGLVAIESLACGTPVLARPVGALPEIVRHGVDGFVGPDDTGLARAVDEVGRLDRAAIRRSVRERFSATRMADGYERLYRRAIDAAMAR